MKDFKALIMCGLICLSGCITGGDEPALPVETDVTHGPRIVFNPLALPVPEIPLPNDLSLRSTDSTVTGAAWNSSMVKPTAHESRLRRMLNRLNGFGPYAPAFLTFDGELDLATISADTVMIVNIEPGHPREGEVAPLDLGQGYFPTHTEAHHYYGHDPYGQWTDLLFPEENSRDLDGDGEAEPIRHYDFETDMLIIRTIMPLAQNAQHAVIITRGLEGKRRDGVSGPIRSPFPYKAHATQTALVQRALELLDIPEAELAFGWTYRTAEIAGSLQRIREGVYGRGPLAELADYARPIITEIRDTSILHDADGVQFPEDAQDHPFILQAEFFTGILEIFGTIQDDDNYRLSFDHVDYMVFGSFESPNLRNNEHREIELNTFNGDGMDKVASQDIPFMLSVPKTTEEHRPPFPVMLYFHGTGTSRFEPIAVADVMAQNGFAVLSFDQVGHGPLIQDIPRLIEEEEDIKELLPALTPVLASLLVPDRVDEFFDVTFEEALEKLTSVGLFAELTVHGRAEDLNEDGRLDIAESFFFADPIGLCSSFWQDLLDMMQLVRVLRNLDPDAVPSTPLTDPAQATVEQLMPYLLSGDFNADGVLDIGGPDVALTMAGTSLGGIHSVMSAAMEPEVKTVTPIVAGGGLLDIMTRSGLHFILEPLFLDVFGSLVVGCTDDEDNLYLSQGNDAERCQKPEQDSFAMTDELPTGTPVRLQNLSNGRIATGTINRKGGFALAIEADRGDPLEVTFEPRNGAHLSFQTQAKGNGSAYARNSSDFRRAVFLQQHAFDQCDPINFARHLFWEPLEGHPVTNTLLFNAIGDDTVPVSTNVHLALAAGMFGTTREEWEPTLNAFRAAGVLDNGFYDVDDVLGDNPDDMPALGPLQPRATESGQSSIRFADVNGKHEWVAGYERDGFQYGKYTQNQLGIFHACGGRLIIDQPADCLNSDDCELIDELRQSTECNEGP